MENEIKATRPAMPPIEAYVDEIKGIWRTGIMTNYGDEAAKFKAMLIEKMHFDNLSLFVNGHSALVAAIKCMGLTGEVITSPFTFASTTDAILQCGLTPVFGDIDENYNLDPHCIDSLVTKNTRAVITPHIFGIPCNVKGIEESAKRHNLTVIYDGAQAFGTEIDGRAIGLFGDATMFSFHAIKVFNTIEGGMLSYRDSALTAKLESFRNFGIRIDGEGRTDVEEWGLNAKMNEFQAAMGAVNLPLLDAEIEKRHHIADLYKEELSGIKGITTYPYKENVHYNHAYYPILVHEEYGISRDELCAKLKARGIGTRRLYDTLTCDFAVCKGKYRRETKNAERISKMCLDLPIYGTLTDEEVRRVCKAIASLRS